MTPVSPAETLRLLSQGEIAFLDVRSEGEFQEGHIPGFVNIPILNNEERHHVGLTFKLSGQETAIQTGQRLVAPFREARVSQWKRLAEETAGKRVFVTCWRGGLRSKIAAEWLREAGVRVDRVQGGYKALRKELVKAFEKPPSFVVLTGLTGTGKTRLLAESSVPKIDLEDLAHHRGSSFGEDLFNPQPSQATFENRLALQLGRGAEFLIEDESRRIGKLILPAQIKDKMSSSPVVILEAPIHQRVELIFDGYVREPILKGKPKDEVRAHMLRQLDLIQKQLGGLLHAELRSLVEKAFEAETRLEAHQEWIRVLLLRHYDPRYRYAFNRQERRVLFQGEMADCRRYLERWFETSIDRHRQPVMVRA